MIRWIGRMHIFNQLGHFVIDLATVAGFFELFKQLLIVLLAPGMITSTLLANLDRVRSRNAGSQVEHVVSQELDFTFEHRFSMRVRVLYSGYHHAHLC